jgi:hypothetical protein
MSKIAKVNFAVILQPSSSDHIKVDKREIKGFLKLPSATFLVRKMLYAVHFKSMGESK